MRCGGDAGAAFAAELDDGDGERRALCRVGAGAELVEEDETVAVADLKDLHDILCMRREGGKRLLDGLLVADVGEDPLVDVDGTAVVGGDMQTALGHEREQADGLERDGLAAGVGSGDDERMAGPDEVQLAVGPHLRADGPHGERQPRPGENALELEQHIVVELDLLAVVG